MLDLINLEWTLPIKIPLLDIKVADVQVDIIPSEWLILPIIHIEAKLDVRLGI